MKSTARPWNAVARQPSHGVDRGKSLSTTTSAGMKTSKSSTSLAFESRLSKVLTARDGADTTVTPGESFALVLEHYRSLRFRVALATLLRDHNSVVY